MCWTISVKHALVSVLACKRKTTQECTLPSYMLVNSCLTPAYTRALPPLAHAAWSQLAGRKTSTWWFYGIMGWTDKKTRTHQETSWIITSQWPQHKRWAYRLVQVIAWEQVNVAAESFSFGIWGPDVFSCCYVTLLKHQLSYTLISDNM